MGDTPKTEPLCMTTAMRLDFVHQQLEHHTHLDTLNRYRDENRLAEWDAICDQLVDHYWYLETLSSTTKPN